MNDFANNIVQREHSSAFLARPSRWLFCLCLVGVVMLLVSCSCSSDQQSESEMTLAPDVAYTGGVAATVNGVEIAEDTITAEIAQLRALNGLNDKEEWSVFLEQMGYTPQSLREQILDRLINEQLVIQETTNRGITLTDDEISQELADAKATFGSEERWNEYLASIGQNESAYRESLKNAMLSERLAASLNANNATNGSEEERLQLARLYMEGYEGAKRSSQIQFAAKDKNLANEVRTRIVSGDLTFVEAVSQYSQDAKSAVKAGDMGWDIQGQFSPEYYEALSLLSPGQLSDVISDSDGLHLILVTEEFHAPDPLTSVEQLPDEFVTLIDQAFGATTSAKTLETWLTEQKSLGGIVKNPMPEDAYYAKIS